MGSEGLDDLVRHKGRLWFLVSAQVPVQIAHLKTIGLKEGQSKLVELWAARARIFI
jgi:hypothetical protein